MQDALGRWSGNNVRPALGTFTPGDRVHVEHEGPGTVTHADDCSVYVRIDEDGEEVSAAYAQTTPLVKGSVHVNVITALIARQTNMCTRRGERVEQDGGICRICGHATMSHRDQARDADDAIIADVINEAESSLRNAEPWTREQLEDAIAMRLGFVNIIR